MKYWYAHLLWILALSLAVSACTAQPPTLPPETLIQAQSLAANFPPTLTLHSLQAEGDVLVICLDAPLDSLLADGGMGAELAAETVRHTLTPLEWRELSVQARDPDTGECRPLSDFLPAEVPQPAPPAPVAPQSLATQRTMGALAGKTVYLSAGHGWQWGKDYSSSYPARWYTQRGIYQDIIEDHNNAEALTQYLIPYLENAGATVISVRERDWNAARVLADNDAGAPAYTESGAWETGEATGYAGGAYRLTTTTTDAATARATWVLTAPERGTYALYAWVRPTADRAPDAHYTIAHAGGVQEVWLDQARAPETWQYLGTFPAYAGPFTVTLDNTSATPGLSVMADALRLGSGNFDTLDGIETLAPTPPHKPWWESGTRYYAQWVGLDPNDWSYFNDIVARPMIARWHQAYSNADAVYISWHTNGYNGTARGTESYVHNGETVPRTPGSRELQQAVHDELLHDIRAGWDADWTDRGKKAANLGEVRMLWDSNPAARVPGMLLEIAFHDHEEDANALKDPRFNQLAARAIYQGIVHYFEARDGIDLLEAPEPPTHLRVQNLGHAVRVAWAPAQPDDVGLGGDGATSYYLYTSPDGFAWRAPIAVNETSYTLTDLTPGTEIYVYVTAVNAGGASLPTEVLGARVSAAGQVAPLLIVNGFDKMAYTGLPWDDDDVVGSSQRLWLERVNRRSYVVTHGQATPAHYAWDSASNEAVSAGLIALDAYSMLDWILGEESLEEDGTLNAAERAGVQAFLAKGGALFISGTELAWDLVAQGRDPDFLRHTLRADYVNDYASAYSVTSTAASALAGQLAFSFDAPGEYDADSPDVLAPAPDGGGSVALTYATGGAAAVQYTAGCERAMVWGFPFETVRPESRPALMAATLDFMDECAQPPDTRITTPQAGGYYSRTPAFAGAALGPGITRVEVQVQRADGAFWDGAAWGAATWLTATGALTWSYPLLPLADAVYTLSARAIAPQPAPAPAVVAFSHDATPPLSPTQLEPQGEFAQEVTLLQWAPPPDTGSPLTYQVDLNGELYTTSTPQWPVTLGEGEHRWRVRAVDAAGNVGPWSAEAALKIAFPRPYVRYIPLLLRPSPPPPTPTPTPSPTPPPPPEASPTPPPSPTPTPPPSACTLLLNSGFEAEDGWMYNLLAVRSGIIVRNGTYAVQMGLPPDFPGEAAFSSIAQTIQLPAGGSLTLRFWAYPIAEEVGGSDYHYVTVWDAAGNVHTLSNQTSDARAWELRTFDLSDYAGQTIKLFIGVRNDWDNATAALYVDDVQIEQCP